MTPSLVSREMEEGLQPQGTRGRALAEELSLILFLVGFAAAQGPDAERVFFRFKLLSHPPEEETGST